MKVWGASVVSAQKNRTTSVVGCEPPTSESLVVSAEVVKNYSVLSTRFSLTREMLRRKRELLRKHRMIKLPTIRCSKVNRGLPTSTDLPYPRG